jgi:hypothetical protein
MTTYLAYIDDSGNETRAVYTALLVPVQSWRTVLRQWLQYRALLFSDYLIPADVELHAAEITRSGKGKLAPSIQYGVNTMLSKRKKVLELSVAKIGALSEVKLIAHQDTLISPESCYGELLRKLTDFLEGEDSFAVLVVDGDGRQRYHKVAHRLLKLDSRRIVEDPWHQDSAASQLVQMADLASYSVFQAHELYEHRDYMWGWMAKYLHKMEIPGICSCP